MRSLVLLVFTLLACGLQAQEDASRYFRVKAWRLTGTWLYTKNDHKVVVVGDETRTDAYHADVSAQAQFKVVQTRSHSSRHYHWRLEKGFVHKRV